MKIWALRIAAGIGTVLVVLIVSIAGSVLSFWWSVPAYEGVQPVNGTRDEITIRRDSHAVPHVLARSHADAAFGLGYVHAQDRLFQMEMSRRYIQGRLSELLGGAGVATDRQMRILGLYAAAEEAVTHLSPETQAVLESYAAGVNAVIEGGNLPIEFTLTSNRHPEPWGAADSVAVLKGMAAMLSGNANAEAARVRLLPILGHEGVQNFLTPFGSARLPDYFDGLFGGTQLGVAQEIPGITASNNWVVAGGHSENGKPLLANDPHLGFTIPSTWYLAHIAFADEDIVGGTLPGIPGVVTGRNRHVAWGLTNTGPDTEDLYVEKLHPDSNAQYQTPGGWANFETRIETILVRFGDPVTVRIQHSRHGPLVDGPGGPYEGVAPPGHRLSLAWTALAPDDTTMEALVGINRAQNVSAFRAAAASYIAPMQNVVYADDSGETGRIGLVLPGRVPIRTPLNDSLGLVPAPGWDAAYDWQGFIPPEEAAEIVDPPSGRVVTANNKTVPDDYSYMLSRDWDVAYRHDRIDALLAGAEAKPPQVASADPISGANPLAKNGPWLPAATSRHSVASFRAIQLDTVDTYALALKSRLLAAGPFEGTAADVVASLSVWDGRMNREGREPLLFAAWARALAKALYADEMGASFGNYWSYRPEFTLRVLDNVDGQARWCDDRTTPTEETCAERIRLALDQAVSEVGNGANAASWEAAHRSLHTARPFGLFPIIGSIFNREIAMDGGAFTVLRADHRMGAREPYRAVHGAGYRGIYDLADADSSLYMISTGQSGNVFSPYYDDLLLGWSKGAYVKIPITPETIEATAPTVLRLQPASGPNTPNRPR